MTITIDQYLQIPEPVTVTIKEAGVIMDCNHAGAEMTDVVEWFGDSHRTLVCDKCRAEYDKQTGEWL